MPNTIQKGSEKCEHSFELMNVAGLPEEVIFICPKCGTPQEGKITIKKPMTQTNTTQNGNAINRIIERTDEITKRELSGNDPSYKIGDNPNEFYQNGTLPVQNASTQPTTQNKEELERKLIGKNVHSVYTLCNKCHSWGINIPLHEVCGNCNSDDTILYYDIETVNKSIQQAHQSGIEEERKRIRNK